VAQFIKPQTSVTVYRYVTIGNLCHPSHKVQSMRARWWGHTFPFVHQIVRLASTNSKFTLKTRRKDSGSKTHTYQTKAYVALLIICIESTLNLSHSVATVSYTEVVLSRILKTASENYNNPFTVKYELMNKNAFFWDLMSCGSCMNRR
jgi:hypothetical protein